MSIKYEVEVLENGETHWRLNGVAHREDGPAIECTSGFKAWFLNGNYHREDGPAIEYADGSKSWYLDDKRHTEDEFNVKMREFRESNDPDDQ